MNVAITGIGIVNPLGIGKENFWKGIVEGRSGIRKISKFNTEGLPIKVAGEIVDFNPEEYLDKRMVVKTDPFTHYALVATKLAIEDAGLDIQKEDRHRIGIWFGNNAGGWALCQRGFYELYNLGSHMVNPWQATGWFPTAAQGFASIKYGILGFSKSFVCDRASGASALYFALMALRLNLIDFAFVGGAEAPLTRFASLCYHETGEMSTEPESLKAYRPFDRDSSGIVLGEGSTVIVLESETHAKKRQAEIYGILSAATMNMDFAPSSNSGLIKAMNDALEKANILPRDIDLVIPEAVGMKNNDILESEAISSLFKDNKVPITTPKPQYGHLYGANTVTELAYGLLCMQYKKVFPILGLENQISSLSLLKRPLDASIQSFLINARSREGVNASFVIRHSLF